ncbi:hypothetical protein, partial [Escherichia coli]|uniref:hypothetical protein n=1 Tax=Escherichia coli TaxID=562 RepID=UPI002341784A
WLMMSLWDALRMNMMISYQELVRTFLRSARLYIPLLFLFILIDSVSFFKPQRPYRYSQVIINKRIKK